MRKITDFDSVIAGETNVVKKTLMRMDELKSDVNYSDAIYIYDTYMQLSNKDLTTKNTGAIKGILALLKKFKPTFILQAITAYANYLRVNGISAQYVIQVQNFFCYPTFRIQNYIEEIYSKFAPCEIYAGQDSKRSSAMQEEPVPAIQPVQEPAGVNVEDIINQNNDEVVL